MGGSWSCVLGQHRNTYIVASDGDELVLVDQHTAHERVRFERILRTLERGTPEAQLLLAPVVVTLAPGLLPLVEAHRENLRGLGYDVEPFGGGSVRLRSVPALLSGRDPGAALETLLREFERREDGEWIVETPRERMAATLACHSSVRAGQSLAYETMAVIVRELGQTAHPTLCPHGRPDHRQHPAGRSEPLVRAHGLEAPVRTRLGRAARARVGGGLGPLLARARPPDHGPARDTGGGHGLLRHAQHHRHAAHDAGRACCCSWPGGRWPARDPRG